MSMIDLQKIYEQAAYNLASELHMYIGLYMKPTSFGKSKGKTNGKNPETGVGTLRLMSGKLYRSFAPKKISDGNIFELQNKGDSFVFTYGSKIKYAAIHEFGGVAGNGAKIPKRPYLSPAVKEWKKDKLQDFQKNIKLQIIEEMKTWLANQRR